MKEISNYLYYYKTILLLKIKEIMDHENIKFENLNKSEMISLFRYMDTHLITCHGCKEIQ